jgi:hypothetical protein
MTGMNLANGSKVSKRRDLDFYPTPPDVTHALMRFLNLNSCRVWEPACGDGAMSKVIEEYGNTVYSTDLRSEGVYGKGGVDFLKSEYPADAIITNPPFNVSEDFIVHAVNRAPLVAMLLKSQYWHAKRRTDLFNAIPPTWVLPLNWRPDFMKGERGGAPTMEVAWTVWKWGEHDTRYRILTR